MALLHINIHKPVTAKIPFFAVIDEELLDEAKRLRWLTTATSPRPIRSYYSKEKGRPVTESLARWVWTQTEGGPTDYVGHLDGDLLNCARSNLVALRYNRLGNNKATEKAETRADVTSYREAHGIPLDGLQIRQGRRLPVSEEQLQTLKRLRVTVGAGLSLHQFNLQIVKEEIGRSLSWRGLQTLNAEMDKIVLGYSEPEEAQ